MKLLKANLIAAIIGMTSFVALAGPSPGPTGEGCIIQGNGQAGVGVDNSYCTYVAPDDSQNLYIASPNHWRVYVVRHDCPSYSYTCAPKLLDGCQPAPDNTCQPYRDEHGNVITQDNEVTLLEGDTILNGPQQVIHAVPGETVYVKIILDCPGNITPACGAWGFLAAGIDE